MKNRNFMEMIKTKWGEEKFVCVGLDSDYKKIPECIKTKSIRNSIFLFNKEIVYQTKDLVCAYKSNRAFYAPYGDKGTLALRDTIAYIKEVAPDVPIILDAKEGDIGNTNDGYVGENFDYFGADAVTISPYLGHLANKPFLNQTDKGIIVLCRTSNPGVDEFQDLIVDGIPLYQRVAYNVSHEWNKNSNCLVVVGATYPEELAKVRKIIGDMPILIPGIGAQGGDVEKTVLNGQDQNGAGMIINSSRNIIFASKDRNFGEAARLETKILHNKINEYRNKKIIKEIGG